MLRRNKAKPRAELVVPSRFVSSQQEDLVSGHCVEGNTKAHRRLWASLRQRRLYKKRQSSENQSDLKLVRGVSLRRKSSMEEQDSHSDSSSGFSQAFTYDVSGVTTHCKRQQQQQQHQRVFPLDSISSLSCFCGMCDVTSSDDSASVLTTDSDVSTSSFRLSSCVDDVTKLEMVAAATVPCDARFALGLPDDVDKASVLTQFFQRMRIAPEPLGADVSSAEFEETLVAERRQLETNEVARPRTAPRAVTSGAGCTCNGRHVCGRASVIGDNHVSDLRDDVTRHDIALLQGEENTLRHEENGEVVMVTEHRVLDAGNRKGHIVIKVSAFFLKKSSFCGGVLSKTSV